MSDTNETREEHGSGDHWHRRLLEGRGALFAVLTTVAISVGGLVEIVPMFSVTAGPEELDGVTPYTPLEVAGRDIYIREGCFLCHSQMVRPFRSETLRYGGSWSHSGEYKYDHPFLLGSRRMGPDLHRVGGKYPDAWHYEHMRDPRSTSPGSVMPPFPWLLEWEYTTSDVQASLRALKTVGVPYDEAEIANAGGLLQEQADGIVERLAAGGIEAEPNKEIIALTAYLQRLGKDGRDHLTRGDGEQDGTAPATITPTSVDDGSSDADGGAQ